MRRAALTMLLLLPACSEDHDPTPSGSSQPASDPSLPASGGDATSPSSASYATSMATVPVTDPSLDTGPTEPAPDTDPTVTEGPSTSTTSPDETTGDTGGALLGWESDVYPLVIVPNCSCHLSDSGTGGLALGGGAESAYAAIYLTPATVGLPYVLPGSAAMSYLYAKVTNTHLALGGEGSPMPPGDTPLPADDVDLLAAWIDAGAPY